MSEARFESALRELRATAPPAPLALRERIRALPQPSARAFRPRPALVAAAALLIAVAAGVAAIGGLTGSQPSPRESHAGESLAQRSTRQLDIPRLKARRGRVLAPSNSLSFDALVPGKRLQDYRATMRLRVEDLSDATKSAVRKTRRLDGYVASADYSTTGNSRLDLRVPVQHVQQAIAAFTDLGTILEQRILVGDLQAGLNRIDRRIAAERKVVAQLEGKTVLTDSERARLEVARRNLRRLAQGRTGLVREGAYAKISLALTTRKPAAKHPASGRFERFWGDAGDILGKEAIIVLYALVVAGPFAILAALALLGERWRRRRADGRLLEETG